MTGSSPPANLRAGGVRVPRRLEDSPAGLGRTTQPTSTADRPGRGRHGAGDLFNRMLHDRSEAHVLVQGAKGSERGLGRTLEDQVAPAKATVVDAERSLSLEHQPAVPEVTPGVLVTVKRNRCVPKISVLHGAECGPSAVAGAPGAGG